MIIKLGKKTYKFISRYESLRQVIVYLFIGGASAASDIVLLFFFVDILKIYYLIAATLSFTLVSTVAFFMHKRFTFRHSSKNVKLRYIFFLITAGSGLLWSLFFLYTFVSLLKFHYLAAAVLVKFIVLIWNFLINKHLTFRKPAQVL